MPPTRLLKERWEMPYEDLVKSLARGVPGSRDFQEGQAVIEARAANEARRLRRATIGLAIVTAVMALATVGLAVAAFLSLE